MAGRGSPGWAFKCWSCSVSTRVCVCWGYTQAFGGSLNSAQHTLYTLPRRCFVSNHTGFQKSSVLGHRGAGPGLPPGCGLDDRELPRPRVANLPPLPSPASRRSHQREAARVRTKRLPWVSVWRRLFIFGHLWVRGERKGRAAVKGTRLQAAAARLLMGTRKA